MFNEYQRKYMEYIASIPREQRCKCGWYLKNKCPHCTTKEGGDEQYMALYDEYLKLKQKLRELVNAIEWMNECHETYSWLDEKFVLREIDLSSALKEIDQSSDDAEATYQAALKAAKEG